MSLILDALKKLEQEKAARRRDLELGPAILKANPRRASYRRWLLAGIVAGVLLACAAGALLFKGRQAGTDRTAPQEAAAPSAVSPAAPAPAVSAPPADAVTPRPAGPVAAPVATPAAPALPAASNRQRQQLPPGVHGTVPQAAPPPQATPATVEPAQEATAPAGLKVTGIAWQEERSGRRAVVNGMLVAEGESVGGVRLVEIRQNRVRFSSEGRTFDIYLASPFPEK